MIEKIKLAWATAITENGMPLLIFKIAWSAGQIILCVLVVLWIFAPHHLGLQDSPDEKNMKTRIFIDKFGAFNSEDARKLEKNYKCEFWINQLKAIDSHLKIESVLIEINQQALNDNTNFINNYTVQLEKLNNDLREAQDQEATANKLPQKKESLLASLHTFTALSNINALKSEYKTKTDPTDDKIIRSILSSSREKINFLLELSPLVQSQKQQRGCK